MTYIALRFARYVNGVAMQHGKVSIGAGINNTYFNGEISEILVYNRVLSNEEAARVETHAVRYLDRYREKVLCYNDDIQGTASVVLAA